MRLFCVLVFFTSGVAGLADTLYLKNGKVVGGTYLGGTARQVRMDLGDRVASYDLADVTKIEFQSVSTAAPDPPPGMNVYWACDSGAQSQAQYAFMAAPEGVR